MINKKEGIIHTQIVNFNNEVKIPLSVKYNWINCLKNSVRNEECCKTTSTKERISELEDK